MSSKTVEKSDWLDKYQAATNPIIKRECLERALLIDPDDGHVWMTLADIHNENSENKANYCYRMAISAYTESIKKIQVNATKYLKNQTTPLSEELKIENILSRISSMMFSQASAYYNLETYSLAIEGYLKSYELNPENTLCLHNIACAYDELEQMDNAIKFMQQYIKTNDECQSHYSLGAYYWKSNEIQLAQESFWNCIEKSNDDANSCYYKSLAFYMLGSKTNQEAFLKIAVNLEPDNMEYKFDLAVFYEENNDQKSAIKYYDLVHKSMKALKEDKI